MFSVWAFGGCFINSFVVGTTALESYHTIAFAWIYHGCNMEA
jgi:hypothetical protein